MAAAAAAQSGRARARPAVAGRLISADGALAAGVAGALCVLAFVARGGVAIGPVTWTQVALILAGAALAALALAAPTRHARPAPLHGAWVLAALAALTVLTAVSVVWSLAADDSWLEANRMLAYLAAFGGSVALARLAPNRWAAVLGGLAIACVVICTWALLTKVVPESLSENEFFARLRAPFGYWNAVGLMAALGVPPLLWLAARRSGHAALGALAYPALGLLLVCLMLSYSRGALLALAVGLIFWFAVVPLRLRSAAALLSSALAAGLVTAWAFAQDGLTEDRLPVAVRADDGHELGVLLALMVVVLLAVGLAVSFLADYRPPSARARRLTGQGLIALLAVALAAGLGTLALSGDGLAGAWNELTDPQAETPANTPTRLTETSSVRARYWDEAIEIHADHPWIGAGAGAYATARTRYRTSDLDVQHAHGYVVQILADLGWAGLALSLAAALAWLAAAAAAIGVRRRDRELPWDAERIGLAALAAVVLVFGVHSLVDWTWYVPANAVAALLCAGWVAGRGPLRRRLELEGSAPAGGLPGHAGLSLRGRLRAWHPDPYRTALAAGVLIIAMAAVWTALQPLRAVHAGDAAVAAFDAGRYDRAAQFAREAAERNPLSVEPLFELAAIRSGQGRLPAAHDALREAVRVQPANSEAWRRLGRFRLTALDDPEGALRAFSAAFYLDPWSAEAVSDVVEANRIRRSRTP